jgi:hypothetical protein
MSPFGSSATTLKNTQIGRLAQNRQALGCGRSNPMALSPEVILVALRENVSYVTSRDPNKSDLHDGFQVGHVVNAEGDNERHERLLLRTPHWLAEAAFDARCGNWNQTLSACPAALASSGSVIRRWNRAGSSTRSDSIRIDCRPFSRRSRVSDRLTAG